LVSNEPPENNATYRQEIRQHVITKLIIGKQQGVREHQDILAPLKPDLISFQRLT